MKYRLDDLLKQAYKDQETPSLEFCRTVILEMKKREVEAPFWKKKERYHKMFLAVACAGMILLVGFGIQIFGREKLRNPGMPVKQDVALKEDQVPRETEHPVGREDQVETKRQTDQKEETDVDRKQDVPQENGRGSSERNSNTTGVGEFPGKYTKSQKNEGEAKETVDSFSGKSDSKQQKPGSKPSVPPVTSNTEPGEQEDGRDPERPQDKEPVHPGVEPEVPVPPSMVFPSENYVALCSVESFSFTRPDILFPSGKPEGKPTVDVETGVLGEIFQEKMIHSYEELQLMIGVIQNKLDQDPDASLQRILLYLQKYQPKDFDSDTLCMDVVIKKEGLELELNRVFLDVAEEGGKRLNIQFDCILGQEDFGGGWQYSVSIVRVSKKIARQCDRVDFQYSDVVTGVSMEQSNLKSKTEMR